MAPSGTNLDEYVQQVADLLVETHGEGAREEATKRGDRLLNDGDMEGFVTWKRIAAAVDALLRGEP